jgi:hypothetical protein
MGFEGLAASHLVGKSQIAAFIGGTAAAGCNPVAVPVSCQPGNFLGYFLHRWYPAFSFSPALSGANFRCQFFWQCRYPSFSLSQRDVLLAQSGQMGSGMLGPLRPITDMRVRLSPGRHLPPMLSRLRFGFDPLESSNEPLRGWGHPDFKKKSRLGGCTELLTQLGTN